MLGRLAGWLAAGRWIVLAAAMVFIVVSAAFGLSVADRLTSTGFTDPGAQSSQAEALLASKFGAGESNFLLLVTAPDGAAKPTATREGLALTRRLAAWPGVSNVASYWETPTPGLLSTDGREALILAKVNGTEPQQHATVKAITASLAGRSGELSVQVGGSAAVDTQLNAQSEKDLRLAELIAFPVTLVLLIVVFGGVIAALLPLALGVFSVLGTFLVLRIIVSFTSVSEFALNLTTALGLGLAIDYSLFMTTRYREELHAGRSVRDALAATMRTAGHTVFFSALTISLAMAALLVFPLDFLRSIAYAGIAVVVLTAGAALIVLPALLAALGPRVDNLPVRRQRRAASDSGGWHRLVVTVMRRPVSIGLAGLAIVVALGSPFLSVHFGLPDDRVLPPGSSANVTAQQLRSNFSAQGESAIDIVAPAARPADLTGYAADVSRLPGVVRVDTATGSYADGRLVAPPTPASQQFLAPDGSPGTWLSVTSDVQAYSSPGEQLVRQIRAVPAPSSVLVGGQSADLVDTEHAVFGRAWIAGLWIAVAMLVILFAFTGSLLLPVQGIVLSVLSLTAMFGAMVYVFQEGHLRWLVGNFLTSGTLDTTTPMLMFCVAFGLSMDYEVFLLSRIRENRVAGLDNTSAVAAGLQSTGPVITAAAAIVAVVFISIGTSSVSIIKMLGIGLAVAVLVDATLIRGVLVPAVMRLCGNANWWAPAPLRRLHQRFISPAGWQDSEDADPARPAPSSQSSTQ